jgi:hypothetical protein
VYYMAANTVVLIGVLSDKEQCLISHHLLENMSLLLQNTLKATSISVCSYFVEDGWEERLTIYLGVLSTSEFIIYNYFPIEYTFVFD